MRTGNRYDGVDDYAVKLIRNKARQLVGRAGFVEADRHDLEQELAIDLLKRLPYFDAAKAKRETFISRIVNHQIATIIEAQKAGKRDYRCEAGSLEERRTEDDGESSDTAPVFDDDAYRRETLAAAQRAEDRDALHWDLEKVIADLPPDLQTLCRRLSGSTVSEVSRETGIPRGTLYESIEKIRARFERAGLAVYLDGPTQRGRPR